MCIDRFGAGTRVGTLEYRDDRKTNEFFLAEIFEIKDFLRTDAKSGWYKLEITDHFLPGLLKLPESTSRRAPFALPFPCEATHTFEVYCVALAPGVAPERTIDNPWLQFTWTRKMLAGNWIVQSTLWTLTDAVPPEGTVQYRESVQEIRAQSAWSLLVPAGLERPHQRSDFGTLPVSWESTGAAKRTPMTPPGEAKLDSSGNIAVAGASSEKPAEIRYKRRKRHRRRRHVKTSTMIWGACVACVFLVLLVLLILALAKGVEHALPVPVPAADQVPSAQ